MFVCNIKMDKKIFQKLLIVFSLLTIIIVFCIVGVKFFNRISEFRVTDSVDISTLEINANNYTDILKDSHENIDKYVGKKIKFIGFVYRLYDFSENQFVLAREMIISPDNQAVVVGFLCDYSKICDFENGAWVEAEGIIEKGNYHGNLPVIKIKNLKRTEKPNNEYVFPPSDLY